MAVDAPGSGEAETDVISLTIPAAMRFVRLVRIGAASIARRKGLSVRAIDDLRLAIDETFALLLNDEDHAGSVDVTFEVDDHEILVSATQRLDDGARPGRDQYSPAWVSTKLVRGSGFRRALPAPESD